MANIVNFRDISTTASNNDQVAGFSIAEGVGTVADFNDAMRNMLAIIRAALPTGIITMWSGSVASIPDGWYLCDGQNGTPDLRAKFIRGAPGGSDPGATGGADSLSLLTANLPAHTHAVDPPATTTTADGSHSHTATTSGAGGHNHTGSTNSTGDHQHTGTTSGDGAHDHSYNVAQAFNTQVGGTGTRVTAPVSGSGTFTTSSHGGHSHPFTTQAAGQHSHSFTTSSVGDHTHSLTTSTAISHTHTVDIPSFTSGSTGSGTAFDNRPAYYELAFIMLR